MIVGQTRLPVWHRKICLEWETSPFKIVAGGRTDHLVHVNLLSNVLTEKESPLDSFGIAGWAEAKQNAKECYKKKQRKEWQEFRNVTTLCCKDARTLRNARIAGVVKIAVSLIRSRSMLRIAG